VNAKLLVESKNDMLFVQAVIDHLHMENIGFDIPICQPDDYECMDGLNSAKLEECLTIMKRKLLKEEFDRIGIIIDQDDKSKKERLHLVSEAVKNVFGTDQIMEDTGLFAPVCTRINGEDYDLNIACFLMNVNGKGELETVLKTVRVQDAVYADCLENWRTCLKEKHKEISDREFDKLWVSHYIRFDTCSKRERRQAAAKCSMAGFEYVMKNKKFVWNLDHPVLDELKNFLKLFS